MVVLPLPAGPERMIAPEVSPSKWSSSSRTESGKPRSTRRRNRPGPANIRTTAFSPNKVGNVLTRISTSPGDALDPPLLGNVGPIGQELGQDLEPRDHVGRDLRRQERNPVQDPIDPPAQLQPVAAGLEMNIAGPGGLRIGQSPLDHVGRIARTGGIELRQGIGITGSMASGPGLSILRSRLRGAAFFASAFFLAASAALRPAMNGSASTFQWPSTFLQPCRQWAHLREAESALSAPTSLGDHNVLCRRAGV